LFHFGHFFKFLSNQDELERIETTKIVVDAGVPKVNLEFS